MQTSAYLIISSFFLNIIFFIFIILTPAIWIITIFFIIIAAAVFLVLIVVIYNCWKKIAIILANYFIATAPYLLVSRIKRYADNIGRMNLADNNLISRATV